MTGNNNGHINRATAAGQISSEVLGLGIAEFASGITSLGVFALADQVAPSAVKGTARALAKSCIEPNLDWIEENLQKVCHLKECQPDLTKSREERAQILSETMIKFGASFVASMVVKLASRHLINKGMGVEHAPHVKTGNWFKDEVVFKHLSPHDWRVFLADESVHLGSFFMVNNGMAKHTDSAIATASSVLQKTFGWSQEKSNQVASMGIVWELPNALGFVAGSGVIAHDRLKANALLNSVAHPHARTV